MFTYYTQFVPICAVHMVERGKIILCHIGIRRRALKRDCNLYIMRIIALVCTPNINKNV